MSKAFTLGYHFVKTLLTFNLAFKNVRIGLTIPKDFMISNTAFKTTYLLAMNVPSVYTEAVQLNQQNGVTMLFAKTLEMLLFFRTCSSSCSSVSPGSSLEDNQLRSPSSSPTLTPLEPFPWSPPLSPLKVSSPCMCSPRASLPSPSTSGT